MEQKFATSDEGVSRLDISSSLTRIKSTLARALLKLATSSAISVQDKSEKKEIRHLLVGFPTDKNLDVTSRGVHETNTCFSLLTFSL